MAGSWARVLFTPRRTASKRGVLTCVVFTTACSQNAKRMHKLLEIWYSRHPSPGISAEHGYQGCGDQVECQPHTPPNSGNYFSPLSEEWSFRILHSLEQDTNLSGYPGIQPSYPMTNYGKFGTLNRHNTLGITWSD